jgi:hypothetical protein
MAFEGLIWPFSLAFWRTPPVGCQTGFCRARTIGNQRSVASKRIGAHRAVWEDVMSGFRFRSPERDRESDERRFGLVRTVVRSSIADAEAEAEGLRARIADARRSAMFLVQHVDVGE